MHATARTNSIVGLRIIRPLHANRSYVRTYASVLTRAYSSYLRKYRSFLDITTNTANKASLLKSLFNTCQISKDNRVKNISFSLVVVTEVILCDVKQNRGKKQSQRCDRPKEFCTSAASPTGGVLSLCLLQCRCQIDRVQMELLVWPVCVFII